MRSGISRRSFLAAGGLAIAGCAPLWPQDSASPGPSADAKNSAEFSSDVKVVSVLTTVRTKSGDIVSNLTKDDFLLSDNKRPQSIQYFSRETDLPLILGLLVDTSGSQRNVLDEEETASYRFLDEVLRENMDKTFLAHFDFDTELLQDLTSSKQKLRRALDEMDVPSPAGFNRGGYNVGRHGRGGGGQGGAGGGTTLYDAVYLASDEILRHQDGRKAVIVLTDGVDHGSRVSMDTAIEAAQRADTLIYSIMFEGDEAGGFGPFGRDSDDGYKVLQKMSRETGGGFFEVSRKRGIDAIYKQIEEELRNQYNIGYSPDPPPSDSAYRTITLKTRRKDLVVQARQGYYPAQQ